MALELLKDAGLLDYPVSPEGERGGMGPQPGTGYVERWGWGCGGAGVREGRACRCIPASAAVGDTVASPCGGGSRGEEMGDEFLLMGYLRTVSQEEGLRGGGRGGWAGGEVGPGDGACLGLRLSVPRCLAGLGFGELALKPQVPGHPWSQHWGSPGLTSCPALPGTDIVSKDSKSTLRVLYSLFCKHKLKDGPDRGPQGPPR